MKYLGIGIDRLYFTISNPVLLNKKYKKSTRKIKENYGDLLKRWRDGKEGGWQLKNVIRQDKNLNDRQILVLNFKLEHPYATYGYMNVPYLWRHDNKKYDHNAFHGMNYLPVDQDRLVLYDVFRKYKKILIKRFHEVFFEAFGIKLNQMFTKFSIKSAEITEEYKAHVTDLEHRLNKVRGKEMVKFSNQTQTTYINDFLPKHQLKMYQKSPEIARIEWTINDADINDKLFTTPPQDFEDAIEWYLMEIKEKINYQDTVIEELTKDKFLVNQAKVLRLTPNELKSAMLARTIESTKENAKWINKLKLDTRGPLIEMVHKGLWKPSRILEDIFDIYKELAEPYKVQLDFNEYENDQMRMKEMEIDY